MPASRRRGEPGKSSSPLSSVFSRPALAGVPADFSMQHTEQLEYERVAF